MRQPSYFIKFIILFLSTFASIFIIWYTLVREESADWISAQIVHQVSPFAVTTADDGKVLIDNVVIGYSFSLPPGFKTSGAKNFSFFMEADGRKRCETRHYYARTNRAKPETADKMVINLKEVDLFFALTGTEAEKIDCAGYLEKIRANLTIN